MNDTLEQTLVLIKPDALKNSLTGFVLSQLSEFHTGLRFAAMKVVRVSRMLSEEHYAEHKGKVFYPPLLEYIEGALHYPEEPQRRRVIALVYRGVGAIQKIRDIAGPTNPHVARETKPGCIRSLGTIVPLKDKDGKPVGERMDNLIHASANPADAEREIKLWFTPQDIPPSMRAYPVETSDAHYYFREGKLSTKFEQGSSCLMAPGDLVWKSDMDALKAHDGGESASSTLSAVAAKYLINV
jgi:nucleoside-diphosphate kinase